MRRYWMAPENLWVAARDGLDGLIIINEDGKRRKISEDTLNLIEHLTPVAKRLNSYEELLYLKEMIQNGSSARRQRAAFQEMQSMPAVVDALAQELETDTPVLSWQGLNPPERASEPWRALERSTFVPYTVVDGSR